MAIREAVVRDHFASRYVRAKVEVRTDFGRIDVLTEKFAVEVEPFATWKHGVRQALAYAQETGKKPAVAIYGSMSPVEAARIWDLCAGLVTVYLLDGRHWVRLRGADQALRHWSAPPGDLDGSGPRRKYRRWKLPGDKRTDDECRRQAAEAINRALDIAA